MSNGYSFEKIDNHNYLKYHGAYAPDGFIFIAYPYFTMITTSYDNDLYNKVHTSDGNFVTKYEINSMLGEDVKVDLLVKGKDTADFILPLAGIDNDYAYFSNNSLTLKVDANGDVTEVSTNPEQY